MKLKILNSNSSGNCYLLESSTGEVLMIECGVRFEKVKQALSFNLKKVVCCLVTHSHGDHCKAINDVLKAGIEVYATKGEHEAMGTIDHHNAIEITNEDIFCCGRFNVKSFKIKHTTPDPVGFLINHPESGTILFLTDSYYSPYKFKGLNNIIVEANFCEDILDAQYEAGSNKKYRDHVLTGHMSIQTCKEFLQANDLSQVNNIVLIHLSDGNSDADRFKREVQEVTGKSVHIADAGMEIPFNKIPF